MKKRILSMLLSIVMVVSLMPTAVFAEETQDKTSESTPALTYSIFDAKIPFVKVDLQE